ncbi:glutamate--tRNA ligase [Treponema primitia ZAS-2]|uniref:Glutamate--tRNA ligase n=1 Tax=Treponema primitia (strain ATCC BAA-887 / DSM 12427 / ZAS-2) TaxID=545694 RepID=F5YPX3_TREPZ|nr:glutamate--tRNA ligase [Treponema primitia]AEF83610.1 glutamate--tRNA ligase [Treponema primitia ZAS-2]
MSIRDRYAPSPTGLQHIGGIRTALFNYLYARSAGGKFILRLEDTDRTRSDQSFVQNLYDTFAWLNLRWDEGPDIGGPFGPYIQSERFELYKKYALELIEKDRAYYCFCSQERLDKVRADREAAQGASGSHESGYDRHCRDIDREEAAERVRAGEKCTIRLKIPLGESTKFHDHLLGDIEWKNDDVNPDPVLLKTDGFPTYHLANIVDDHLMGITHVLRAQEWLSSTPLHVIMYKSFGWEHPEFCHLPMVMGQDGKKLSKRHGATSIDEFRRQGYLPEALLNYVALLGASYEEGKEIYTPEELSARFSLEKLNKAPAIFDYKKLEWFNGQYIRMKSDDELAALALPYAITAGLFGKAGVEPEGTQKLTFIAAMPLIKERINFLHEAAEKLGYLFSEPPTPAAAEFIPKKSDLAQTVTLLKLGRELVRPMAKSNDADAEALIKAAAEKAGVKLGDLMMPLRVAVTGARVSPPLFGSLRILGAEQALARVDKALAALSAEVSG